MKKAPHADTSDRSPSHDGETPEYRPDSASVIHTVANRRDTGAMMLDRDAAQREQVERNNVSLLLHALHESGEAHIPAGQRRIVREAEVQRAIAVLRRFNLLHPGVKLEQLLDHCEQEAAHDRDTVAHLVDPFQLRHVLSYHEGIPHEELTPTDLYELDRAIEHGPDSAIGEWFAAVGARAASLPPSTPAFLRTVFARACEKSLPAVRIELLSFELAVLTLRIQGVIGLEDTRLFFSLIKQIAGDSIPALAGFLESAETNHAVTQHQAVGNTGATTYFRQLAGGFDHTALGKLEQRIIDAAATKIAPAAKCSAPSAAMQKGVVPAASRRGLIPFLHSLGQSLFVRG